MHCKNAVCKQREYSCCTDYRKESCRASNLLPYCSKSLRFADKFKWLNLLQTYAVIANIMLACINSFLTFKIEGRDLVDHRLSPQRLPLVQVPNLCSFQSSIAALLVQHRS